MLLLNMKSMLVPMDNLSDTSSTLKADSSAILDVSVAFTQVAQ